MIQETEEALIVPTQADLIREEQDALAAAAALNPATIATFIQIGSTLFSFASSLFGGKTGSALNDISKVLAGFGDKILSVSAELQKLLTQVDAVITAIDQTERSRLAPVHQQVLSYMLSFPNGVPQVASTSNPNYVQAHGTTASVLDYFQKIKRGPFAIMPTLCQSGNSRMELAISAWPCWYVQSSPDQPFFTDELNQSGGHLSSYLANARPSFGKEFNVKPIMSKPQRTAGDGSDSAPDNAGPGPGHPIPVPPEPIGWQVREGTKVVWQKMDPNAYAQANNVKLGLQRQRQNEILAGYMGTLDRWTNMTARMAGAGIARALDMGDARTFLRFVNPSTLVMEEPEHALIASDARGDGGVLYRALPMRDVLLDILTSSGMRERHGLLVQGADKRAINTWFAKAFFRQPTPAEQTALLKVVELFGNNAFFGCLAYSDEYEQRFGDGIPGAVDRRQPARAASAVTVAE